MTAAFIGPGTITTASRAGAEFGSALAWAILFSVMAAIVLQEMAGRVGLVTRGGLGEAIRASLTHPLARALATGSVVVAIALGNAAYQTGNLTGAAIGLGALTGLPVQAMVVLIGAGAGVVLAIGRYELIERVLVLLVIVMSFVFAATAVVLGPDLGELARGLLIPNVPRASLVTVIALIGTTVVPYNLFLHASAVREKWSAEVPVDVAIRESRRDTILAVSLGGGVTLSVMITAGATAQAGTFTTVAAMGQQLEPVLGRWASGFFAAGLAAAGVTSAVTAPLAAAYATAGAMGWPMTLRSRRFRAVWAAVLLVGMVCAIWFGGSPIQAIILAQAANGLILPFVVVFLLIVVNRKTTMKRATNGRTANALGVLVVLVAAGLGAWKLWRL